MESSDVKAEAIKRHGVTQQTYYAWKRKYGGMQVDEAKRLKELEKENQRLKKIVADQTLMIDGLREINSKKW